MAVDPTKVVVAPSGTIWVADFGATPPTNATDTPSGFDELGLLTTDGVTPTFSRESNDIYGWQVFDPVKTIMTSRSISAAMAFMEWKDEVMNFALGAELTDGEGGLADPEDLQEKTVIIDWEDGTDVRRLVLHRCIVTGDTAFQLQRGDAAVFPVTLKVMAVESGSPINFYKEAIGS